MRTKLHIKLGFEKSKSTEFTQALIFVVNAALGGGNKGSKPTQDEFQAHAAFANLFGKGSVQTASNDAIFEGLDKTFEVLDSK